METSGFFTSHVVQGMNDRAYTAAQFSEYFHHFVDNGVFPAPSAQLQVVPKGGWEIAVLEGFAWINGYWFKEDGEKILTIDFADDYMDRIDAVVLRWNKNEREIKIGIKRGIVTPGGQRPALQRDDNIYELCLAYIKVGQGATQITQEYITDTRSDVSLCGMISTMNGDGFRAMLEQLNENIKSLDFGFTSEIERLTADTQNLKAATQLAGQTANGLMSAADKKKLDGVAEGAAAVVTGAYTGDGTANRTITLGFTPKAILVMSYDGSTKYSDYSGNVRTYYYGGLALPGYNVSSRPASGVTSWSDADSVLGIVPNGFKVNYGIPNNDIYIRTNSGSATYMYMAIK